LLGALATARAVRRRLHAAIVREYLDDAING
jgi:hypothetical protein